MSSLTSSLCRRKERGTNNGNGGHLWLRDERKGFNYETIAFVVNGSHVATPVANVEPLSTRLPYNLRNGNGLYSWGENVN